MISTMRTTALHDAIRRGDYTQVEYMLGKRLASPNSRASDGANTLMVCARGSLVNKTDSKILKLLLQYGADVDSTDSSGRTPLIEACIRGKNDLVRTLLTATKGDIDLMRQDDLGRTALMYACIHGNVAIVKLLLKQIDKYSLPTNTRDLQGNTALSFATMHAHKDVINALLREGCRPMSIDEEEHMSAVLRTEREGEKLELVSFDGKQTNIHLCKGYDQSNLHNHKTKIQPSNGICGGVSLCNRSTKLRNSLVMQNQRTNLNTRSLADETWNEKRDLSCFLSRPHLSERENSASTISSRESQLSNSSKQVRPVSMEVTRTMIFQANHQGGKPKVKYKFMRQCLSENANRLDSSPPRLSRPKKCWHGESAVNSEISIKSKLHDMFQIYEVEMSQAFRPGFTADKNRTPRDNNDDKGSVTSLASCKSEPCRNEEKASYARENKKFLHGWSNEGHDRRGKRKVAMQPVLTNLMSRTGRKTSEPFLNPVNRLTSRRGGVSMKGRESVT